MNPFRRISPSPALIVLTLTLSLSVAVPSVFAQIGAGGTPPSFALALSNAPATVEMVAVDVRALEIEDALAPKDEPLRFAAELDVALNLTNSGTWETLSDGSRLWRLRIVSPGALTLGFLFDHWYIPKGGELWIYNDDHSHVIGAFTEFNNWIDGSNITQPVKGDAVTLEYLEPASIRGQSSLSIYRVCHGYRNVFRMLRSLDAFGSSGSCNNNINCPEGANWQDEKRGVAMILSGGSRICTGSLINNTAQNFTPYFLTANHCLGGESSWVFMFNYESPSCSNVDGPTNQTVANATRRSNWATSDFALLQLSSTVPQSYNPYFNGWNRVNTAPTSSVCIHHPSGDIKKISFDNNAPVSSGWYTSGDNHWKILAWDDGTTEPGSSGSPLFDPNGRIIGQLHGGDASCTNNVNDYFGKFAYSWTGGGTNATRLSNWLDPLGTAPNTLDGINQSSSTPPNDVCPGFAITALPYSHSGSTATAANNYANCVGATSPDVVYTLTLSACYNVTVSLCGSGYDTGLGVRSGGSCPGTTQVACNDDATCNGASSTQSVVTFQAQANTAYYLIVHGYAANSGNYTINVTGTACNGGANNDVCPGLSITSLPYTHSDNTCNKANNYTNCVGSTSRDAVYTLRLTTSRSVTVSLCGSGYDTGLGVRRNGTCPGTTQVACNDDATCNGVSSRQSRVTFTANANTNYFIIVHGYSTNCGTYTLNVSASAAAGEPGEDPLQVDLAPKSMELPTEYALAQNYPNPFNPTTSISFALVEAGFVKLAVYDVLGKEVAPILNGHLPAGVHTSSFDGSRLPSGVYLYRLEVNGFSDVKKMVLMK